MKNISRALCRPTSDDTWALAPSRPTLISVVPKVALSLARMMSQHAAKASPAPMAGPLTAAMTGTAQSVIAHIAARAGPPGSIISPGGTSLGAASPTVARSTPAMKARLPADVKMAARTDRSASNESKIRRSSSIDARSMAFTGGRSKVTVATPSSTWTARLLMA